MTLLAALRRTRDLLKVSDDSDWTPWTAAELTGELEVMVWALERGEQIDPDALRLLFLPTGPLQETSMANGWSTELLALAETVDRFLKDP
jgi:hypothetical protein